MHHRFFKIALGVPAIAAILFIGIPSLTTFAQPSAGPTGGNVDATFSTLKVGNPDPGDPRQLIVDFDGRISYNGGLNGGSVNFNDDKGIWSAATSGAAGWFRGSNKGIDVYCNTAGCGSGYFANSNGGIASLAQGTLGGSFTGGIMSSSSSGSNAGDFSLLGGAGYAVRGSTLMAQPAAYFDNNSGAGGTMVTEVELAGPSEAGSFNNVNSGTNVVLGSATAAVYATSTSSLSKGVIGRNTSSNNIGELGGAGYGVGGTAYNAGGYGMYGYGAGTNGIGVHGQTAATNGSGVFGRASANNSTAVYGQVDVGWTGSNAGQFVNVPSGSSARLGTPTAAVDATGIIKNAGLSIATNGDLSDSTGAVVVNDNNGLQIIGGNPLAGVVGLQFTPVFSNDIAISAPQAGERVFINDAEGMDIRGPIRNWGSGTTPLQFDDDQGVEVTDGSGTAGLAISATGTISNPSSSSVTVADTLRTTGTNDAVRLEGTGLWTSGAKLNLGDGDFVHISEPTDDNIEIKSSNFNVYNDGQVVMTNKATIASPGGSSIGLDVAGRIRSGTGTGGGVGGMWVNSSDQFVGSWNSDYLGFYNNGTWGLRLNRWGNSSASGAFTTGAGIISGAGLFTTTNIYALGSSWVNASRFVGRCQWSSDLGMGNDGYGVSGCSGDVAEAYPTKQKTEPGDILMFDMDHKNHLELADRESGNKLAGVVSTSAGVILTEKGPIISNGNNEEHITDTQTLLVLTGKAPVKVNTENGAIKIGDYITVSSTPGVGMKANAGDEVIGIAMENFEGGEQGKIFVLTDKSGSVGLLKEEMDKKISSLEGRISKLEEILTKQES